MMIAVGNVNAPEPAGIPALDILYVERFPTRQSGSENNNYTTSAAQNPAASANIIVQGIAYSSASEATCARLLERYVPGFSVVEGESYQVPIGISPRGNTLFADFQIDGVIVEFHPPRVWRPGNVAGDFRSRAEKREYGRAMRRADPQDRKEIKEAAIEKLGAEYFEVRRRIMDESPEHRSKPLVVALSAADFYDKVVSVFADPAPARAEFLKEFFELRDAIFQEQKQARKSRLPAALTDKRKIA